MSFEFNSFTGEMIWFFDSIMLPPNVNAPEGEGFVSYSISPLPDLPDGTVLSNRAHIRFDYEQWLDAPEAGPLDLTINPCPPCECPYQSDFDEDGFLTSLDLTAVIDILFNGDPDIQDPGCYVPRGDFDCDGFTTALDLTGLIDHLFVSGPGPCDPCG